MAGFTRILASSALPRTWCPRRKQLDKCLRIRVVSWDRISAMGERQAAAQHAVGVDHRVRLSDGLLREVLCVRLWDGLAVI